MEFRLTIPGDPFPWERTATYGRRRLTPAKYRAWKRAARCLASAELVRSRRKLPLFEVGAALLIRADFVRSLPRDQERKRLPPPVRFDPQRSDVDNYLKAVMDALNGVVYADDRQVVRVEAQKLVAGQGEAPGVHLLVKDEVGHVVRMVS